MEEILPSQKVTFRFRPTEQMLDGIKTIEPDLSPEKFIYPDDFKLVVSEYEKAGKKVVIVTDRVSKGDVDRGELGSGYEADNYDKVLSWCMKNKSRNTKISKVFLFNWPFAWLSDAKKAYKAYEIFYQRFVRFIDKVKPDAIVVCGPDVFEFIAIKSMETLPKQRWRHQMNRVLPITIGKHQCAITGTIDMLRPLSWDNKNVKDFPNLIGYLARGILAGFEGKNRYTVTIPQDKKFIYVDTIAKVKKLLRKLRKAKRVSIDTEGASLNRVVNQLYSIQFAFSGKLAYFLPMDHPQSPFKPTQLAKIKTKLREYFENAPDHSEFHIFQNAKYDLTMFHSQLGVRYYSHRVYDVQAGEFCFHPDTLVMTEDGYVKIRELVQSPNPPKVLSYNHKTSRSEYKPIINASEHTTDKVIVEIEYEGGTLRVTEDHKIWSVTRNAYVKAGELDENDEILIHESHPDDVSDASYQ